MKLFYMNIGNAQIKTLLKLNTKFCTVWERTYDRVNKLYGTGLWLEISVWTHVYFNIDIDRSRNNYHYVFLCIFHTYIS